MNSFPKIKIFVITAALLAISGNPAFCGSYKNSEAGMASDSLSLKEIIAEVIKNHPSIKGVEETINNADARIGLAKTGSYPQVDMGANYSFLGPVTKISIPNMGTFQLYPQNNYSASVNFREVIYDFGRTRQSIAVETESKIIGEKTLDQARQKLSAAAINNFYTIAFLQDAIIIKDEQLAALKEHLRYVETLKSTGSANDYQILSTKVKISTVESQKVDIIASLTMQQSYLNCLLGLSEKNVPVVKKELYVNPPVVPSDSLLSFAYRNRDEILINNDKVKLAQLRYELVKTSNKPYVNFMASGGAKNGYLPNLNEPKPNYVLGVGFSVPLFDGMKTKYNLAQAESAIHSVTIDNESLKRTVTSDVIEAVAYMNAAVQKVKQFELQLEQAQKAYSLAETSFRAGSITNLDLLDSNTAVSESMLMLLKARIDYAASIYRLKAALGERLY
jgi:outer membrane protein